MIPALIILICLILNALFSCAEMAFVSVDKRMIHREAENGSRPAQLIRKMLHAPERVLSVVQIGITLVAAISAAVSGALATEYITPWFISTFQSSKDLAESLSIVVVVVPITFLTVLIGELVPKSLAIRSSYRISLILAPGLRLAERSLGFLVTPLEKMTNFLVEVVLKPRKVKRDNDDDVQVSIKDLKKEHKEYVQNIIELDVRRVKRALVKWDKVVWVNSELSGKLVLERFLKSGFTRIIVLKDGKVHGFIHLKEFLQVLNAGEEDQWFKFVRPPVFISSNLKIINALQIMKNNRVQILIVGTTDEPLGIVTLEDVIEEVVGDITDETEDKQIVGFLRHMVIRK